MNDRPPLSLFSALSVRKALDGGVLAAFTAEFGVAVDVVYDPTSVLLRHVADGARPDVVIAITDSLTAFGDAIDLSTSAVLALSGIGIAVPADAAVPPLSTVDELCAALVAARSVAYSRTGASGIRFAGLLTELGIADQVGARATVVEKGFTAEALLDGRADLAVQQLSELAFVPEVRIAGPLPEPVQHYCELSVVSGAGGRGKPLSGFLTRPAAAEAFRATGLRTD
ncbi:molybdate ABC transporter substrate-binding protein [Lentzea pudingi]|uniref:Molybdate ABC transporter substrate-binding protein n=1 Tax=Lentzea pudingi TaxID=1789439 RepID=A0ABQ2HSI5_9PSEU|nr:substrate-binding domain-containing protein [Lentzea pudingi]GGM90386.1 molybdate ABC transporter substrate-binding protein [Lentzea pudingi]